jgi:hypothetical protein
MVDLPILFSAPMVRALIREVEQPGTGKTQTRRILTRNNTTVCGDSWRGKSRPWEGLRFDEAVARARSPISGAHDAQLAVPFCHPADEPTPSSACGIYPVRPLIEIGDRLWVRETVACGVCAGGPPSHWAPSFWRREQGAPANPNGLWYAADGLSPAHPITERGRWVPGIHMPRWASRLTLTVTDVRVERLQEITEADALAEGMRPDASGGGVDLYRIPKAKKSDRQMSAVTPVGAYRGLWDHLHGAGSWDANPWIVALTFNVERRNIDA